MLTITESLCLPVCGPSTRPRRYSADLAHMLLHERLSMFGVLSHFVSPPYPHSIFPTPPHPPLCSAVLAHIVLQERLNMFGVLGCLLCITGSVTIVLHAPPERHLGSVIEVFQLAMQPGGLGLGVGGGGGGPLAPAAAAAGG